MALTEEQVQLLLDKNLAIVATLRRDGTPHLTPTWIDYDGENVVFNTAIGRAKERHLRRDPRVAVTVVDRNDFYRWVSLTGTAELLEEGAYEHIDKLEKKYRGGDRYPLPEGQQRVMVRIRPERVDSRFG